MATPVLISSSTGSLVSLRLVAMAGAAALFLGSAIPSSARVRIKDIAMVEGVRSNQLIGQGVVVGLNGGGDKNTAATSETLAAILSNLGRKLDPSLLKSKNIAAVMLTAEMPPFARPGNRLDVTVSTMLDAKSLEGGVLLQSTLHGADGQVYAVAQGGLVVGGFSVGGAGESVQRNIPTVAELPAGAIIERAAPAVSLAKESFRLFLDKADFGTVSSIASALRRKFGSPTARAVDSGTVEVTVPSRWLGRLPDFISEIEQLAVEPDMPARVVINERTGTVVVGEGVRISQVAVAHGNLSVAVSANPFVSQPEAFSGGDTVLIPGSDVQVVEGNVGLSVLPATASLNDLVSSLNLLGASPRDVMSILQALRAAGALHAELVVL